MITIVVVSSAVFFIVGFLLCFCTISGQRSKCSKIHFDRERIVAHRNKKTLIIPEGEPSKDENQVLYFTSDKTAWHR